MNHIQHNDSSNPATLFLSESFLKNGFCLSPIFHDTHFLCASFDFVCGCVCITAVLISTINKNSSKNKGGKKQTSMVLPGSAIYFLAHSFGHYALSGDGGDIEQQSTFANQSLSEKIQDVIILASIISIGPLDIASTLIKAKKLTAQYAYIMAGTILTTLVAIFFTFIPNQSFVLLYINISIVLSIALPKLLFVGYTSDQDVMIRSNDAKTRVNILSGLFIMVVIICEPFFCDLFFARIGGHLIFDLSLALDVLADVMMGGDDDVDDLVEKKTE